MVVIDIIRQYFNHNEYALSYVGRYTFNIECLLAMRGILISSGDDYHLQNVGREDDHGKGLLTEKTFSNPRPTLLVENMIFF